MTRAQILADEGGERHGEAGNRKKAEAFDFGVRAEAGHGHFAEGIDIGLYDHIGKGDDGILDSGGKPQVEDLQQDRAVDADVFYLQTVDIGGARYLDKA